MVHIIDVYKLADLYSNIDKESNTRLKNLIFYTTNLIHSQNDLLYQDLIKFNVVLYNETRAKIIFESQSLENVAGNRPYTN